LYSQQLVYVLGGHAGQFLWPSRAPQWLAHHAVAAAGRDVRADEMRSPFGVEAGPWLSRRDSSA
jgi:hypothetical protein